MALTSREIVQKCLRFQYPPRMPRELWAIPWAYDHLKECLEELNRRFPSDFGSPTNVYRPSPRIRGGQYEVGSYTDEWGCVFFNVQKGVHGEVRDPILPDLDCWKTIEPPWEILPENRGKATDDVNRSCEASPLFMRAGCCPRPWERYQFIRGTENAMIDMITLDKPVLSLLKTINEFYLAELEFWVRTEVDAISFMDDWGSQHQLLIPPAIWRQVFKPMYRDYCDLAHSHGKFVFMHSDGHITEIYPDLVEIGVDALNSQLFCMDIPELARIAKDKITFWGEIDRQHVLPSPDPAKGRDAVRYVAKHLYDTKGGIIAQFELSPGSNPAVAFAIFEEWEKIESETRRSNNTC